MIQNFVGDVLTSNAQIIAHQVNCQGVMGSGVALQVKNKWPEVFKIYEAKCNSYYGTPLNLLGTTQIVQIEKDKGIANMFGQLGFGTEKRQTNYEAFYTALEDLKKQMINYKLNSVAFPVKIGSDRGGANWNIIKCMIEEVLFDFDIEYWTYCP